jgi:membrane protease YdiL (CAAX protease family)
MNMKTVSADREHAGASRRALYVTLAVVILSMIPGIFISALKPLTYIATLVYISGEHRNRGHSWEELGIKVRGFKKDLRANWHLILIVVILLQLPVPLIARAYWPDLLRHISDRIPLLNSSSIGPLILVLLIIPFFEELIYRGLLQQRLAWYLNGVIAVVLASVVFGLQHFTAGSPSIVAADLAGVFVDGLFFGWIFSRCRNILVSWPAHVAADLVGLVLLTFLV